MGTEGVRFPDITSYERMGPYMDTEQKVTKPRPPRRRKPYTLRAVLSNLLRDLREWWNYRAV